MAQIRARPKHLFSWGFDLYLDGEPLTGFDMSWLREGGHFVWDAREYHLSRNSLWSGDFLLTADQEVLALANKESPFARQFTVRAGDREMILETVFAFTRSFRLVENGSVVGHVVPDHFFTRACTVEFPDDLPMPVQVFLFWLVVLMWRRDAD